MFKFRLRIHWNLFPRVQLTILQHWFRLWLGAGKATSHYLNQMMVSLLAHICVTRPQGVNGAIDRTTSILKLNTASHLYVYTVAIQNIESNIFVLTSCILHLRTNKIHLGTCVNMCMPHSVLFRHLKGNSIVTFCGMLSSYLPVPDKRNVFSYNECDLCFDVL